MSSNRLVVRAGRGCNQVFVVLFCHCSLGVKRSKAPFSGLVPRFTTVANFERIRRVVAQSTSRPTVKPAQFGAKVHIKIEAQHHRMQSDHSVKKCFTHVPGRQGGGLGLSVPSFAAHQERPVVGQLEDVVARVGRRHLPEGLRCGDDSRLVPLAAPGKLERDLVLLTNVAFPRNKRRASDEGGQKRERTQGASLTRSLRVRRTLHTRRGKTSSHR